MNDRRRAGFVMRITSLKWKEGEARKVILEYVFEENWGYEDASYIFEWLLSELWGTNSWKRSLISSPFPECCTFTFCKLSRNISGAKYLQSFLPRQRNSKSVLIISQFCSPRKKSGAKPGNDTWQKIESHVPGTGGLKDWRLMTLFLFQAIPRWLRTKNGSTQERSQRLRYTVNSAFPRMRQTLIRR